MVCISSELPRNTPLAKSYTPVPPVSSKIERACFGVASWLVLALTATSVVCFPPNLPHCEHLSPRDALEAFDLGISPGLLAIRQRQQRGRPN